MLTYSETEIDQLLKEVANITNTNERTVVVSHLWWHHFSHDVHPRCPKLEELKNELPYPKDEVDIVRIREITSGFPDRFRNDIGPYIPPEFDGSLSKYADHKSKRGYSPSSLYSIPKGIFGMLSD